MSTPPTPPPPPADRRPPTDDLQVRLPGRLLASAGPRPGDVLEGFVERCRYRLTHPLGRSGGFGELWRAERTDADGRVTAYAVKLLRTGDSGEAMKEYRRALRRGDHVVRSVDCSRPDAAQAFIVMEYVDGRTLRQIVETSGPLGVDEMRALVMALASALRNFHSADEPGRRMYHGDLQPSNVMRADEGRFVVVDLGLGHHDESQTVSTLPFAYYPTPELGRPVAQLMPGQPGAPYTGLIDVYQAAQVLTFALTGEHPTNPATSVAELAGLQQRVVARLAAEGHASEVLARLPGLADCLSDMLSHSLADRARLTPLPDVAHRLESCVTGAPPDRPRVTVREIAERHGVTVPDVLAAVRSIGRYAAGYNATVSAADAREVAARLAPTGRTSAPLEPARHPAPRPARPPIVGFTERKTVGELARLTGASVSDVIAAVRELGPYVRSHQSTVAPGVAEQVTVRLSNGLRDR